MRSDNHSQLLEISLCHVIRLVGSEFQVCSEMRFSPASCPDQTSLPSPQDRPRCGWLGPRSEECEMVASSGITQLSRTGIADYREWTRAQLCKWWKSWLLLCRCWLGWEKNVNIKAYERLQSASVIKRPCIKCIISLRCHVTMAMCDAGYHLHR